MIDTFFPEIGESTGAALQLGVVTAIDHDVAVDVRLVNRVSGATAIRGTILETSSADRLRVEVGDTVLVWVAADDTGVVLGRVPVRTPGGTGGAATAADDVPDTLLLEAKDEIMLRVGDGSITIRADGKILIKGTDLVSHAKRMNRIKGGAVSIN